MNVSPTERNVTIGEQRPHRSASKPSARTAAAKPDAAEVLRRIIAERAGGEVRPQQELMVAEVEKAIADRTNLVVQAGTGTGKSLGYLVPAILSGCKTVVSTGTKALSEQIAGIDLPLLQRLMPTIGGPSFTYALLKGRSNYICLKQVAEILDLGSREPGSSPDATVKLEPKKDEDLFGNLAPAQGSTHKPAPKSTPMTVESIEPFTRRPTANQIAAMKKLFAWVGDPNAPEEISGDRSDLPAPVTDQQWAGVSIGNDGCLKKKCRFWDDCYSQTARDEAKAADIIVTNHAVVARDIQIQGGFGPLGDFSLWVADEGHEVENYVSSSLGTSLNPVGLRNAATQATNRLTDDDFAHKTAEGLLKDANALAEFMGDLPDGTLEPLPENLSALFTQIVLSLGTCESALGRAADKQQQATVKDAIQSVRNRLASQRETVQQLLVNNDDYVRWHEAGKLGTLGTINVAPLRIGPDIMRGLGPDRTLIVTSATLSVGGSFDAAIHTFGLNLPVVLDDGEGKTEEITREHRSIDVGSPFDYPRQAILYVPDERFPAPDYKTRDEHAAAVLVHAEALIRAAGGRALVLFTTAAGAAKAAKHLRQSIPELRILAQGDMNPGPLAREFAEDETSVLCATLGFWTGLDVPGPSCSVVIVDKIPFAPMNDPLMAARRRAVENAGGDGFGEVFVASATVTLAQGAGRLIRSMTDKGVIAVLDTRIKTKRYGEPMLRSLPNGHQTRDLNYACAALTRLTGGLKPAARPVFGSPKRKPYPRNRR